MTKPIKGILFHKVFLVLVSIAVCQNSHGQADKKPVEVTGGGRHGELTAGVFGPGKGPCTNMRLYLASEGPHLLMWKLMNSGNGPFAVSIPGLGPTQGINSSDQQLARLADGDVVLMWQASTSAALSTFAPGQIKPVWWNDWGVMKNWDFDMTGKSPVGPNQAVLDFLATHLGVRNGFRSANLLWRFSASTCKWSATPMALDSGEVSGIKKDGSKQVGYCAQMAPGLAGFDRLELHADPWGVNPKDSKQQRLYVSTFCGRCERTPCPALQNRPLSDDNVQVFVSPDTGANWKPVMRINAPQPVAMTSTAPNGRLFMFNSTRDGDSDPGAKLYWLDPNAGTGHGPYDITYEVKDPKDSSKKLRYLPNWLDGKVVGVDHSGAAAPLSLARTGPNSVLAVYPAVENAVSSAGPAQRQIAVAVWVVTHANNSPPLVVPIKIIRAEAERGSVLLPTLIEDDRRDAPSATTMLYWIETTAQSPISVAQTGMVAKYTFFTNGIDVGSPTLLTGTSWKASNTEPRAWLGDYMKGSFYFDGKDLNFIAAWPQVLLSASTAQPENKNTQAYIRIIKLSPQSLKSLPDPKGMPGVRTAAFVGQGFLGNKP